MKQVGVLQVSCPSDTEIRFIRDFAAPPQALFAALTEPALIARWLLGPEGWTMPVCRFEAKVGGSYRYEWHHAGNDARMGMGGTILEIESPSRIVANERFDEAWYEGSALDTTELAKHNGGTRLTLTVRYGAKDIRDQVYNGPAATGLAAGYDRLDALTAPSP